MLGGRQTGASTAAGVVGRTARLEDRVSGDIWGPGNSILSQEALQAHVLLLQLVVLGAKRRIVPELGLLLLVTAVPGALVLVRPYRIQEQIFQTYDSARHDEVGETILLSRDGSEPPLPGRARLTVGAGDCGQNCRRMT